MKKHSSIVAAIVFLSLRSLNSSMEAQIVKRFVMSRRDSQKLAGYWQMPRPYFVGRRSLVHKIPIEPGNPNVGTTHGGEDAHLTWNITCTDKEMIVTIKEKNGLCSRLSRR